MIGGIDMEYSLVGKRIRQFRLEKNMTQVMLAEKSGLSEAAIYSYETGKRLPALEPLINLSNALDVPTDSLLCDYLNNVKPSANGGLMDRMERLPKPEKERILKIMDALVKAV